MIDLLRQVERALWVLDQMVDEVDEVDEDEDE